MGKKATKKKQVTVGRRLTPEIRAMFDGLGFSPQEQKLWLEGLDPFKVSYLLVQVRGKSASTRVMKKTFFYQATLVCAETQKLIAVCPDLVPEIEGSTRALIVGKEHWTIIEADIDEDERDRAEELGFLSGMYKSYLAAYGEERAREKVMKKLHAFEHVTPEMVFGEAPAEPEKPSPKPETKLRKQMSEGEAVSDEETLDLFDE